ncbi:MAG: heme-dependent peroxidase [Gemmatimonadaceae bacterium]|nr:heme-dependent peroxidase [Gemmatimonadaceae bacterium]NUO94335.1 heme-dependent peroxidase [Gemmatimonadaceae bacterium]NUP70368.1 heme-dependent peroxidase [Gemmatimonadaceae bacterium]NUS47470.1 heme-dependent peroxidase [Gemmatimonadaceae bacterium]
MPDITQQTRAHPPETTEGWYVLHQMMRWDRAAARAVAPDQRHVLHRQATEVLHRLATPVAGGWSAVVPLIGSVADVLFLHFRPTLEDLGAAQRALAAIALFDALVPVDSFLSVTEAGLYHASAQLATAAAARGGAVGDEAHRAEMARRVEAERASPHVQRRLFPVQPAEMPYVCFYPMSKRRAPGQNWYALSLEERSRLMMAHGLTGRGHAGRVVQVISGAIGLDAWEWGVTLFASDPLAFKKIVTDMRFDEVSAQYAEFGKFYVGKTVSPETWLSET